LCFSQSEGKIVLIKERAKMEQIVLLLTAAAAGNSERFFDIINSGDIDVHSTDENKRSGLHIASAEGHLDLVQSLLDAQADPSSVDVFNNTCLNEAVRHKRDDIAALIRRHNPLLKYKLPGKELGVAMCSAAADGDVDQLNRLFCNVSTCLIVANALA